MIPGLGKPPGERKVYPLQYYGLENSMDCSSWGRKESDTTEQLSLFKNLPKYKLPNFMESFKRKKYYQLKKVLQLKSKVLIFEKYCD